MGRVPVSLLAALHELDFAAEMVDDFLVRLGIPPLGREVVFAAGHDDPEMFADSKIGAGGLGILFLG
jgi:hypothetical protein